MAGIITLSPRTTLATVREHYRYTAARLNKHKLTVALRAPFKEFETRLAAAEREEEALLILLEEAIAAVEFIDDELDAVVDTVSGVTGNQRGPGLYRELYGNKRISEFKRPVLNEQFDTMEGWPQILEGRTDPVLISAKRTLEPLLPEAKEAQSNKNSIKSRLVVFRETGTRAQVIDEFNALRKSCFGELSKLEHEHGLPRGWAESFFRQGNNQEPTLAEVDRRIAARTEEIAHLEAVRAELLAKQAAAEETERLAAERRRQAEIARKREQLAKLEAELAKLEDPNQDPDPDQD